MIMVVKRTKDDIKQIGKDIKDFIAFCKSNKILLILTSFFVILSYGIKLFYNSISIDTEVIINSQGSQFEAWLSIQRFGLIVTKKLFGFVEFNPYVASLFMLCTMFMFCLTWSYLFNFLSFSKDKKSIYLSAFSIVFITTTLFVEQFIFILQGFEVAFAIMLCSIAVLAITKWILNSSNKLYLVIGVICIVWSFGTYQAIIQLYISGVLASYILIYINNKREKIHLENNFFIWAVIKYIVTFFCGLILIKVVTNYIIPLFISQTQYLDNLIMWDKRPASECIDSILKYVIANIKGSGLYCSRWFAIIAVMLMLFAIVNLFSKRKDKVLFLLAIVSLLISPFLLCIYAGNELVTRSQFSLQFVIAFGIYLIIDLTKNCNLKKLGLIVAFFIALHQGYTVARLLYTDYMRYENDKNLALKISMKVEELNLGEIPNYPVVFVGNHTCNSTPIDLRGEVIGASFFEWDGGTNYRIHGFLNTLGYSYVYPNSDEIEKGKKIAENMEMWPDKNSVKFQDNIIVVKLSD